MVEENDQGATLGHNSSSGGPPMSRDRPAPSGSGSATLAPVSLLAGAFLFMPPLHAATTMPPEANWQVGLQAPARTRCPSDAVPALLMLRYRQQGGD